MNAFNSKNNRRVAPLNVDLSAEGICMLKTQHRYVKYLDAITTLLEGSNLPTESFLFLREKIARTEILVPVIGSFSAGKSSLLNAFLGTQILNVGLAPETELATELRFSPDPCLLAVREDGTSERMPISAMATIKSRAGEFTHLQLYLDNPFLEKFPALVLVDMPGFGSSLVNHNKAIAYYLPRGACYIVVISVEDGNITQSMLRQLDDLQIYGRPFTFVLNKTNLRSDEQVKDVSERIDDQIAFAFADKPAVTPVGRDGQKRLIDILATFDPEKIFQHLFSDQLKDLANTVQDQINLALSTMHKTRAEAEYALHELQLGMRQICAKRDALIADVRAHEIQRTVDQCLDKVGHDLNQAHEELLNAALSPDTENFSRLVSEIVRHALTPVIQERLTLLSHSAVSGFGSALNDIGKNVGAFGSDSNWVDALSDRIARGVQKAGTVVETWNSNLAIRHENERKQLQSEAGGKPLKYQGLATVLSVTASVVSPLLNVAIIFLPNIINFITQSQQRTQLSTRLQTEIIPAIKRQMRSKLSEFLGLQIQELIEKISAEFEHDIAEKQSIIEKMSAQHSHEYKDSEKHSADLTNILESVRTLTSNALYKDAQI